MQARRLREADVVSSADGIFSNVSNFRSTADEVRYDEEILGDLGDPPGLHIVVDTSRNGNGPGDTWCDPKGRAIGRLPTVGTGNPLVDAYLWIKDPGQADGCADPAGMFDPQIAYGLIADGPGGAGIYTARTPSPGRNGGQGSSAAQAAVTASARQSQATQTAEAAEAEP